MTRKLARMFQGAKVSLGDVGDLGREGKDMSADQVAYLCARYMQEHGEPDPGIAEAVIYRRGIMSVLKELFGYEEWSEVRVRQVRDRLRANGIRPWTVGPERSFNGWIVPNGWVWSSDEPIKAVETPQKGTAAPESPVVTKWACRTCGKEFDSLNARNGHEVGAHISKPKKEVAVEAVETATATEVVERTVGAGDKLRALTPEAKLFLAAVQKDPGLHLRDYQRKLHMALRTDMLRGVVYQEGATAARRIYPKTTLDPSLFPDAAVHPTKNPTRDKVLKFVKENPGVTGQEIADGVGVHASTSLSLAYDLVAMRKLRKEGKPRMREGSSQRLRFYPVRSGAVVLAKPVAQSKKRNPDFKWGDPPPLDIWDERLAPMKKAPRGRWAQVATFNSQETAIEEMQHAHGGLNQTWEFEVAPSLDDKAWAIYARRV